MHRQAKASLATGSGTLIKAFMAITCLAIACGAPNEAGGVASESIAATPIGRIELADSGGGAGDGSDSTCARATVQATALPVELIVVLDRSKSMCNVPGDEKKVDCDDPSSRWQIATRALTSLFGRADAQGIRASLIAFPVGDDACVATTYAKPLASRVALPDTAGVLSSRIAGLGQEGSTPTLAALRGAIQVAKNLETAVARGGRVAIVLVTDGLPAGCADAHDVDAGADAVATVKATIPTYVIGVGPNLAGLDAVAVGGGTGKALLAESADANAAAVELSAALGTIRGSVLACEYTLPAPPPGETLDLGSVNIQVSSGTTRATLGYSAGCADPEGWRYDDPNAPTRITLCASACEKAKTTARIDVVLGCKTSNGLR